MNKIILVISFLLTSLWATVASASVVNGSYEDGLNGWVSNNSSPTVVTSYDATDGSSTSFQTMEATDGDNFVIIPSSDSATILTSSTVHINEGDTVSFDWFASNEGSSASFSGYALEILIGNITVTADLLSTAPGVGEYGLTGWQTFEYVSSFSGDVVLKFYSLNLVGDPSNGIILGIDNVAVTPVPLSKSSAFMTIGLGVMGFTTTRRRSNHSKG